MRHDSEDRKPARRAGRLRRNALGLGTGLVVLTSLVLGFVASGTPAQAAGNDTIKAGVVAQISYAPNSYVIGNAYENWTDVIQGPPQFASGPGNPGGENYRWGFLVGPNFSACGWIVDGQQNAGASTADRCGATQQIDTPHFRATYTNGQISPSAGDGDTATQTNAAGCTQAFGNVEPWRVPATPGSPRTLSGSDTLKWRYVTKDGNYVMVHDTAPTPPGDPNWFFVPRGCISF